MTNWQTKKLGDLAAPGRSIISGPFGSSIGKRFFVEDGVPVIRGNNLTKGVTKFKDTGFVYLTPEKADDLNAYAAVDDIIYTAAGTIGQVGIIPKNAKYEKYTISNKQIRVRLDAEKIMPEYAYKVLSSNHMIRIVESQNTGSTIPLINLGIIKSLSIQLPPIHEQERIVSVLEVWDEYTEKLEQKIALKEQMKKGLMQQLLTGKRRLPGFTNDWQNVRLGDIAKMQSGGTPSSKNSAFYDGDIIWVSIADMTSSGKYLDNSQKKLTQLGYNSSTARLYPKNTILYAMYASIGECVIAKPQVSSSQAILGIQPGTALDLEFLYYYLVDKKDKIKLLGQQGTQSNLNAGIVKDFEINLPSIKEQLSISRILADADSMIEQSKKQLGYVQKQKKYLLKKLITGTIRTPEDLKPLMQSEVQS